MKIFTIIVTYNGMQSNWIEKCLNSLRKSTVQTTPIVVDNYSNDSTCNLIAENYPEVVLLPQKQNLGFGKANNIGINYAIKNDADYIMLLNQDAQITNDTIEKIFNNMSKESLCTPYQLNGNGTKLDCMFRAKLRNISSIFFDDIAKAQRMKKNYVLANFPAACWFVPTVVIKKIGGFNPLFDHYGEDDNYYNRLRFHKIRTELIPSAFMMHDRNIHGNTTVFDKNEYKKTLLIIATDINLSWSGCLHNIIKATIREINKNSSKFSCLIHILSQLLWLVKNSASINQSRKKEKQIGCTWL